RSTATGSSSTSSSRPGIRASRCPRSSATTRASYTPTRRTTTARRSASSAPGSPRQRSGGTRSPPAPPPSPSPRPSRPCRPPPHLPRAAPLARGPRALRGPRPRRPPHAARAPARAAAPARPRVGRAAHVRELLDRAARQRRRPGDLRDRLPPRLPARPAARRARRRARARHRRRPADARARLPRQRADRRDADARSRARRRPVGLPGRGHADGRALRRTPLPEAMSYTLTGRVESRLAALALPLAAAFALGAALGHWWPVELAALMVGVGLVLDLAYDRTLPYQPGWAALPLGLLELGLVMALARSLGVPAPLSAALAIFAGAWLWSQLVGQALLPLWRWGYTEEGGELGVAGAVIAAAVCIPFAASGGLWWHNLPPTVRLSAGVHHGPLFVDRRE